MAGSAFAVSTGKPLGNPERHAIRSHVCSLQAIGRNNELHAVDKPRDRAACVAITLVASDGATVGKPEA